MGASTRTENFPGHDGLSLALEHFDAATEPSNGNRLIFTHGFWSKPPELGHHRTTISRRRSAGYGIGWAWAWGFGLECGWFLRVGSLCMGFDGAGALTPAMAISRFWWVPAD